MGKWIHLVFGLLLVFALVAGACGNSGDEPSTTAPAPSTGDAAAPSTDDSADDASDDAPAPSTDDASDDAAAPSTDDASDDASEEQPVEVEEPDDSHVFIPIEGVPGVNDAEISVAVIGTKSNNPLGTCILDCYTTGIEAYFDMMNSQGGLYGRELVIGEHLDDELFNNQATSLEVIAEEDSLAVFVATLLASGFESLDEARVPAYNWGAHAAISNGLMSNFPVPAPSCPNCTVRHIPYMAQIAGATRVAALGYGISENSKVCANTYAASIDLYSGDIGAETVYVNDEIAFGVPNGVGPQVTEMIEAGVDFIASCLDLNAMKTIAQELVRQGVRDEITMHHPNSYDHNFVAEAGDIFDGDLVSVTFAPFETSGLAAVDDFLEWTERHGGPVAEQTIFGWVNADLFVQGLKAAGPEFDRESLIEATNTHLTSYSADGLVSPIDWSRQHLAPTAEDRLTNGPSQECVAMVWIQGGAFELVAESDSPFLCWDNSTPDWAEPEPTKFG